MTRNFDKIIISLLTEADKAMEPTPAPNNAAPPDAADPNAGNANDPNAPQDDLGEPEEIEEEPVSLEELELAKLAVRALNFNVDSKDVHKYHIRYKGERIPFEKIPDFFEQTKNVEVVLPFIEWVMDKYEGIHSRWTEQEEFKGKGILDKIKAIDANATEEEKLDCGKRVYWTRLILNCLLFGSPDFNLVTSDVTLETVHEIFALLKQHFGNDTRGLKQDIGLRGPSTF